MVDEKTFFRFLLAIVVNMKGKKSPPSPFYSSPVKSIPSSSVYNSIESKARKDLKGDDSKDILVLNENIIPNGLIEISSSSEKIISNEFDHPSLSELDENIMFDDNGQIENDDGKRFHKN